MGYDGMSFKRLSPMKWKKMINTDANWGFEGSNDEYGKGLEWNFKNGYQLLLYYRVE
jgi:hypothetical protein